MGTVLRTRGIDALIAASEEPERRLRKTLGPWSLTALGIGAVIGSGIFTLTGTAAAGKVDKIESVFHATVLDLALNGRHAVSMMGRPGAGPAITLSFVLVAIACLFAGLCYAELASMIPVAIAFPMFPAPGQPSGIFNIPALLITLLVTWVLVIGVREGARANTVMVGIKIAAIAIFCLGSMNAIHVENWKPFAPHGFPGILTGASIVFFTYIGFDSISTAAEEGKMPQRDLPFGIIATLIICTILYGSVALVLTGIAHYQTLNTDSPVADALKALGYNRLRLVVTFGALIGMISSLLVYQYGQARIWFAMSRDGLLPGIFSRVHKVFQTPHISTWIAGFVVGIPAGIWDIDTFAELSNIGTLFAFIVVSAGVIVLRKTQPDRPRSFRTPLVPLVPILSIACCVLLMAGLPLLTWIRFFVWLVIGLAIYFLFGRRHSVLETEAA